jgi:hypothetical protein
VFIINLVIVATREIPSQHAIASDFQNSLLFFPVLRENGTVIRAASLRMIGGKCGVFRRTICAGHNHVRQLTGIENGLVNPAAVPKALE